MEVSLVDAHGVPEGCLLSIRAGSTRRQAPLEQQAQQPFKFPHRSDKDTPFKVDILSAVGSSQIMVRAKDIPNAGVDYTVPLTTQDGSTMGVTLRVKEGGSLGSSPAGAPPVDTEKHSRLGEPLFNVGNMVMDTPASRRHLAALRARTYLEHHNMLSFIQGLLQTMIKEQPSDPWDFIASQLPHEVLQKTLNRINSEEPGEKKAPMPPSKFEAEKLQSRIAQPPQVVPTAIVPTELQEMDRVRLKAQHVLASAARNGSLVTKLGKSTMAMKLDKLRKRARSSLSNAARSGKLKTSLDSLEGVDLRVKAAGLFVDALNNGSLQKVMAEMEDVQAPAVEVVRGRAVGTLVRGAVTGDLTRVLLTEVTPAGNLDMDEVRRKPMKTLESGIQDNRLADVLAKADEKSHGEPSVKKTIAAVHAVTEAQEEKQELQAKCNEADATASRVRPSAVTFTVEETSKDHEPAKKPPEPPTPARTQVELEVHKLQCRVANGLTKARVRGNLQSILENARVTAQTSSWRDFQHCDVTDLKKKAQSTFAKLVEGAEDPELLKLLEDDADPQQQNKQQEVPAELAATAAPALIDDVPKKTHDTLQGGLNDGKLDQLLSEPQPQQKPGVDLAAVRAKANTALSQGMQDGNLVKLLDGPYGELDRLRLRACEGFSKASVKPIAVLGLDRLRLRARSGLSKAAAEGRLVKALEAGASRPSSRSSPLPPKKAESDAEPSEFAKSFLTQQLEQARSDPDGPAKAAAYKKEVAANKAEAEATKEKGTSSSTEPAPFTKSFLTKELEKARADPEGPAKAEAYKKEVAANQAKAAAAEEAKKAAAEEAAKVAAKKAAAEEEANKEAAKKAAAAKEAEQARALPADPWAAVADTLPEVLEFALSAAKMAPEKRKSSKDGKSGSRGSSRSSKSGKKTQLTEESGFIPEPPPAKHGGSQSSLQRSPSNSQTKWRPGKSERCPSNPQVQWQDSAPTSQSQFTTPLPSPPPMRALGVSQSHIDLVNEVQAVRGVVSGQQPGVAALPSSRAEALAKEVSDLRSVNARMRERNDILKQENTRIKENIIGNGPLASENMRLKRELEKLGKLGSSKNAALPGLGQSRSTPGLSSAASGGLLPPIHSSAHPAASKTSSKGMVSSSSTSAFLPPINR
eukprot:gnl/MRDRNA2_/MRDRNA2_85964_c0_seq1.p1 gnl/MRDRNA2_/MRDRNA2_85964_c0~~gnl/MRDRNA2_/MRDRNA2_85964_c0_seq1.p1  ORF type:complete len:1144 (+),score=311.29 gnl/MRDRNA2_/MRDRNA2_85964_c0_seq1:120-3551(+)